MFDTCTFNTGTKSVTHIVLILTMQFLSRKRCDILRLYGMEAVLAKVSYMVCK